MAKSEIVTLATAKKYYEEVGQYIDQFERMFPVRINFGWEWTGSAENLAMIKRCIKAKSPDEWVKYTETVYEPGKKY